MPRVPVIGRLYWREYTALIGSLCLIALECVVRVITLGLPYSVIRFLYKRSKAAFNWFEASPQAPTRPAKHRLSHHIAQCSDFVDLAALFGYRAEEHIAQTGDGYLLGLHRLSHRKDENAGLGVNAGECSIVKPVVYLHHGLLMNSEVWLCLTDEQRCLPFVLVEKGYDVWFGNNRGNKYSKKSSRLSPASYEFWDFSIDQFAFHDIPDSIDYILKTTHHRSLSYIGFSQGTAQAFAALSIHASLNDKVNLFVALAPAMSPAGLRNGIVDSLVKASPEVLFLAFGRKSLLGSTPMWQSILYPPIFVKILDMALSFLFDWSGANISQDQKLAAYPHLYSYTSTKSVVHWFQIIRTKSFQMFDDDVQTPLSLTASDRYYKVARFPTRNIRTPIVLLYGGSDSLVDIDVMLQELPQHTVAQEIAKFEHLDFLWGAEVDELVFPTILRVLEMNANQCNIAACEDSQQAQLPYRGASTGSLNSRSANTPSNDYSYWTAHVEPSKPSMLPRNGAGKIRDTSATMNRSASPCQEDAENVKHCDYTKDNNLRRRQTRPQSRSSLRIHEGSPNFTDDGISVGASDAVTAHTDVHGSAVVSSTYARSSDSSVESTCDPYLQLNET